MLLKVAKGKKVNKYLLLIALILAGCQPIQDDEIGTDDFVGVNKTLWMLEGNSKPYPFTAEHGEIACSMNEVYFFPADTANNESLNGTSLNRLAQIRSEQANLTPSVANTIKPSADLSEAITIGLDHCEKVKSRVASLNS